MLEIGIIKLSSIFIIYPQANSVSEAAIATNIFLLNIKLTKKLAILPSKLFWPNLCFPNVFPIKEAAASPKNNEI